MLHGETGEGYTVDPARKYLGGVMNLNPKKHLRFLAFFMAFLCSMFLTGCGGGGGGGGGNSPVGPNPTTTTGTVDGYVSRSALSISIRTNIGAAITNPVNSADVSLIALDGTTGAETPLGAGKTDDQGHYQIGYSTSIPVLRNLILRATSGGETFESLLPELTNGVMVRAPTMDPDSDIPVKIIKEAAKHGKNLVINLGELLAVLPPEALKGLESKITELVNNLLAREDAKEQKFGPRLAEMRQNAFDLQQRINASIEKGELTKDEGWKLFKKEMTTWAKAKGFTAEELQLLDDMDQAFLFEPFKNELESSPEMKGHYDDMSAERLRDRKLAFLSVVSESVKILVGNKSDSDFAPFFQLIDKIKASLETALTPGEITRFFQDNGHLFLDFGKYLGLSLIEVKFTPQLVNEVFQVSIPKYGFGSVDGVPAGTTGGNTSSPGMPQAVPQGMQEVMSPDGDPAGKATGFIRMQEEFISSLMDRVKTVADKASLNLTREQTKAVAYIIWAQSEENLNFPAPPVPGDDSQYPITSTGRVEKLAVPVTAEGLAYSFTHKLLSADYVRIVARASSQTDTTMYPMPSGSQLIAYLAQDKDKDKPIQLIDASGSGQKTITQVNLADLEQYQYLQIEGLLVKSPYQPMPVPAPGDPNNPTEPPPGTVIPMAVSGNSGSGSGSDSGSAPGNPGTTDPSGGSVGGSDGSGIMYPGENGPMYLLVNSAIILPPPPPPPEDLTNEPGKVVQALANGKTVPGLFVFDSANTKYDGAILQPVFAEMMDVGTLSLSQWLEKDVKVSGIFFQDGEKKIIQVTDIR